MQIDLTQLDTTALVAIANTIAHYMDRESGVDLETGDFPDDVTDRPMSEHWNALDTNWGEVCNALLLHGWNWDKISTEVHCPYS